jgi:flavodoxin
MNIAVRYQSRTGNTAKIADAIASATGVTAETIAVPVPPDTDLLYIGGAIYGFGLDPELIKYIAELPQEIKRTAIFSSSALVKSTASKIRAELEQRGLNLVAKDFHCYGEFKITHRHHPSKSDLDAAADWARDIAVN